MDSPNVSKMIWSTMKSQTLFPASGNSSKLSTLDTGNDVVKYPTKLTLPEPLETRPNRSLTLPSLTTSPAKCHDPFPELSHIVIPTSSPLGLLHRPLLGLPNLH